MLTPRCSLTLSQWCELQEVEGRPQQREEEVDPTEHRGRSIGNAHCIQNSKSDISHAVEDFQTVGFVGLVRQNVSEWIFIVYRFSKKFFDQAEGRGFFWTLFLLKYTGT